MKKIDVLLIRSFLPPLLMWTFIAMFIFNMQFLWKYIDDIIGKGLDVGIIMELLFYQSLAMIPRAMVFGVLIAAVMTLGNLAEHYELVTLKSAGVSLFRVMRPLLFVCSFLAATSLFFSDQLIPFTALKFKTILNDVRQKKPALSFEEGQYNNDFQQVSIFVGKKGKQGKYLHQVKIYEHNNPAGYKGHTAAKRAALFFTQDTVSKTIKISQPDGKPTLEKDTIISRNFLVIKLENGTRYDELAVKPDRPKAYPHMQMNFETYTTMFDLSEFDFNQTNEDLFKNHHSLLSIKQLLRAIDSLYNLRLGRYAMLKRNADAMFQFRREGVNPSDTAAIPSHKYAKHYVPSLAALHSPKVVLDTTLKHFGDRIPDDKAEYLYQRAAGYCRNIAGQANGVQQYMRTSEKIHVKYENEIYQKLSFAFACLLFLFIGAPMGAIIRKGGFGYPILVAFIFFMIFFVLYLAGERLAKNLALECWLGAWLPNIALFPFGFILTYKAINDTRIFDFNKIKVVAQKVFKSKKKEV